MKLKNMGLTLLALLVLISCSEDNEQVLVISPAKEPEQKLIQREINPKEYSYGQQLFLKNCAVCHGKHAEGGKNWRKLGKDRKFPPPPLNGTGHAWHHSTEVLVDIIKNGTINDGGNMPAWKNKLSDLEIEAILAFLKSHWPDEIYKTWYDVHVLKNDS
ncbi:MAG: cytochrome c [Gammaproteobacteria bacterium]|nr:cytochrome c [Gammaproteobacteria bacterium]